uniref:Glycosyltransferase family 92 protein n=1 Tax=Heterorhabditis bacteriophora TaxID=37862 RepID=A0A1I7W767_HETBA
MARSNYASFWQSRIKLAASSAVLTILVILIDYRKVSIDMTRKKQWMMSWKILTIIFRTYNRERQTLERDHFYIPNLITCPLPNRFKNANELIISVSRRPCQSQKEAIKVQVGIHKTKKESVAVCVKGMDFQEDISKRLIEWLEAQYLLGVDTISIYTYTVSRKTEDVLKYYESLGKLEQKIVNFYDIKLKKTTSIEVFLSIALF